MPAVAEDSQLDTRAHESHKVGQRGVVSQGGRARRPNEGMFISNETQPAFVELGCVVIAKVGWIGNKRGNGSRSGRHGSDFAVFSSPGLV